MQSHREVLRTVVARARNKEFMVALFMAIACVLLPLFSLRVLLIVFTFTQLLLTSCFLNSVNMCHFVH